MLECCQFSSLGIYRLLRGWTAVLKLGGQIPIIVQTLRNFSLTSLLSVRALSIRAARRPCKRLLISVQSSIFALKDIFKTTVWCSTSNWKLSLDKLSARMTSSAFVHFHQIFPLLTFQKLVLGRLHTALLTITILGMKRRGNCNSPHKNPSKGCGPSGDIRVTSRVNLERLTRLN